MASITVVVNSSLIPSHPSNALIKRTLESLEHLGIGLQTPILVVQDALPPGPKSERHQVAYRQYLDSLRDFDATWPSLRVLELSQWGHINGALREAMKQVATEFVLVIQHDLEFLRDLDIHSLAKAMSRHPEIKHVRFNKKPRTVIDWDAEYEYRNKTRSRRDFIEEVVVSDGSQAHHLVRTLAWSDNNYLCRKSYLTDTVFALTGKMRVPPEHVLNPLGSPSNHRILGTYIYGRIDEPPYISHLDGRNAVTDERSSEVEEIVPWHHGISKHLGDARLRLEAQMRMLVLRLRHREASVSGD